MNACWSGCSAAPPANPSTVVISRPSYCTARARQELIRSPSARTVHAPHAPWLQPFFEPVSPRWSRTRSSRDTRGSDGKGTLRPLMEIIISPPHPTLRKHGRHNQECWGATIGRLGTRMTAFAAEWLAQSIRSTGVSTESVRMAASAFIAALTEEQRAKTLFPVDDLEWRKWMNQHFY